MNGPGAGGGREGVLPEHLEYLSEAFKGPAGANLGGKAAVPQGKGGIPP